MSKYYIDKTPIHIINECIIQMQTDEEIENDLLEIKKMLYPKKFIIVSHYNSKLNGEYMYSRNKLINLLDIICIKHNIPFINPTNVLSNFTQNEVMIDDLGHYTDICINYFSNYINSFVNESFK